jgi:D-alanyl-D-alanine carboxypeptidase/D-alanyl-D-alanine-endopeptidase (penicillin-binding protein 4)
MRVRPLPVIGAVLTVVLVTGGGYVTLDALDIVTGPLTVASPPPTQAPFPDAPAAAAAPPVEAAVGHLDPDAPMPSLEAVGALADALADDPRMGSSVGVVVTDVLTGQVLADVDGARARTPASTTKLLTALAAGVVLGAERTLVTRVVAPDAGRIVLVGGGDMMLAAGAGDPAVVNGRAGLADLAAQTAAALQAGGVTQVALALDDTLFSGSAWNPGWHPAHISYVAPTAAVAVNGGKTQDVPFARRYDDPALATATAFAALLTAQGLTVTGPTRGTAPQDATEIAAVESAPMREIIRYVVRESDNTIAEVLGRLVAIERGEPGTFGSATAAIVSEVAGRGIDTSGVTIADCSGLADGSRIPAGVLASLLVVASAPGSTDLLPVTVDLPVSGWQGTLFDRFVEGPARGLVRAKTGSLPGVTSLAGTVLTSQGRLLAFAVIADATPAGGQDAPRAAIDAFVGQLVSQPAPASG